MLQNENNSAGLHAIVKGLALINCAHEGAILKIRSHRSMHGKVLKQKMPNILNGTQGTFRIFQILVHPVVFVSARLNIKIPVTLCMFFNAMTARNFTLSIPKNELLVSL